MLGTLRDYVPRIVIVAAALQAHALAQEVTFCLNMDGAQAGTNSTATGVGTATLDMQTNIFSWNISHQGLSSTHLASHFHGPAPVGQNAGVQVDIGVGNPLVGSAPLNQQQVSDLLAGLWYVNLHTQMEQAGEIRTQVDTPCFTVHCSALANSFDAAGARLTTGGDLLSADNAFVLQATGVPPISFGFLLIGQGTGIVNPPASSGNLCLTGQQIGRFNQQILLSDCAGGMGPFTPDILNLPNPPGGQVMAGETWRFQAWFRDGNTNNFTDAITVVFK